MSAKRPPLLRCFAPVNYRGKPHWECRYCTIYSSKISRYDVEDVRKSSGNAWRHVESKHPMRYKQAALDAATSTDTSSSVTSITSPPAAAAAASKRPASPSSAASVGSVVSKRPKLTPFFAPAATADTLARQAAIAFAVNHLSFRLADSGPFRAMLEMLHSPSRFPNRRTIQATTLDVAKQLRQTLLQRLRDAKAPVGIAFDGWTNNRQYHREEYREVAAAQANASAHRAAHRGCRVRWLHRR
jgi:hypothetical protein